MWELNVNRVLPDRRGAVVPRPLAVVPERGDALGSVDRRFVDDIHRRHAIVLHIGGIADRGIADDVPGLSLFVRAQPRAA